MTLRKLASVRKIDLIVPHKNADRLEVAILGGWPAVVRKGEFQAGQLVLFFEVDTLLPPHPAYDFLAKSCSHTEPDGTAWYWIKTARLRGQLSQGLVLPLDILWDLCPDDTYDVETGGDPNWRYLLEAPPEELTDAPLDEMLGLRKYEKRDSFRVDGSKPFPFFIPRTDEVRIQNLDPTAFRGKWFELSEKLDGMSCTVYKRGGHIGVCSRNREVSETSGLRGVVEPLLDAVSEGHALQGEVVGPGIQGNPYRLRERKFFAYNLYDFTDQGYINKRAFLRFCERKDIPTVPSLGELCCNFSINDILKLAEGKSKLNPAVEREGIVWVTGSGLDRISFKAISNKFLLKNG